MEGQRIEIDYGKTLGELTEEQLVQVIFDFLDKGEYVSRSVKP